MQQGLNVDRYLNQRVGILRRLVAANLPPVIAERWVEAWEAEAERRGLDRRDRRWWRSGWEWIAKGCGGPDPATGSIQDPGQSDSGSGLAWGILTRGVGSHLEEDWRNGPFAQSTMRVERQVLALAESLRRAMNRADPVEEGLLIQVLEGIHRSSDVIAAFRGWVAARARYRASDPSALDHEWLRGEMERLCAAYEAAVGEAHGP